MNPDSSAGKAAPLNILVVDDEVNVRRVLSLALEADGHHVAGVGNVADALAENSRQSFDLAFVDLRLGVDDGLDLIPSLLAAAPWIKVIVITAYASIDTAVEAMRRGALDYIPKPFTPAQIRLAVGKAFALRALEHKLAALQDDLGRARPETDFSSAEPVMQRAVALARQAALLANPSCPRASLASSGANPGKTANPPNTSTSASAPAAATGCSRYLHLSHSSTGLLYLLLQASIGGLSARQLSHFRPMQPRPFVAGTR